MNPPQPANRQIKLLGYSFEIDRRFIFPLCLWLGLLLALALAVVIDLNRVQSLKIAAGARQGESYIFSQAMAKVVARHQPKIQIQVVETEGSEQNIERLEKGAVQLATAQADTIPLPSARIVAFLFPDTFQLIAANQSGIQQISDLKGKRIALPPEGGGQYKSFWFVASHYRLTPTDFNYKAMSEQEGDLAFRNNQVDAVFRVRPPGNQSIQELVQSSRGRLVAIDQAAAMKIKQPAFEPSVIPKGSYQGNPAIPPVDLPTVAVQRILLANQSAEAETMREVTGILQEHRQELAKEMNSPLPAYISPPTQTGGTGIPVHLGAQAYYDREKPSFFQENADYLGLLLTLVLLMGSWFWGLKNRIERGRKNRADRYNQDIVNLIEETYNTNDPQRLRAIRDQLFTIFKTVVDELDRDQISPESFQSFTFTWETAIAAVRDRESLLMGRQTLQKPVQPKL